MRVYVCMYVCVYISLEVKCYISLFLFLLNHHFGSHHCCLLFQEIFLASQQILPLQFSAVKSMQKLTHCQITFVSNKYGESLAV